MDFGLDMDVSDGRIKVAFAGSEQGFAFSAAHGGDKVRLIAVVAEGFSDGAGACVSLHVGFASAVVDDFAWWFAPNTKCVDVIGRRVGSPKCVAVELALCCFWGGRGEWWCWRGRSGGRGEGGPVAGCSEWLDALFKVARCSYGNMAGCLCARYVG